MLLFYRLFITLNSLNITFLIESPYFIISLNCFQMKPLQIRVAQRFRLHSKLEGDHQALLFKATHSQTNEKVLIKGEENKSGKPKRSCLSILQEGKVYQTLQGGIGIPYMHFCGQQDDYNFLVIQQLDSTLLKLKQKCGGRFSLKTSIMIAKQILNMLQYFHFKHFCYNNLCAKHVMIGKGQNFGNFYFVDYSKTNRYIDPHTQEHSLEQNDKTFQSRIINMQFSSYNYQIGNIPTRRDDLQSLMYLIAFMLKGELPWSAEAKNMKKADFQKLRNVIELKVSQSQKLFSEYKQLQTLMSYTKGLKFDQKPQYSYYNSLFDHLLQRNDLIDDKIYDWIFIEDEPLLELNHKFNLFEGQQQILSKISNEIAPPKIQKKTTLNNNKALQAIASSQKKSDKQCVIY